jgi:hypothetical protein
MSDWVEWVWKEVDESETTYCPGSIRFRLEPTTPPRQYGLTAYYNANMFGDVV